MKSVVLAAALASCGHPAAPPVPPTPGSAVAPALADAPAATTNTVGLSLTVTPPDAEVLIDGVSHGKASSLTPVIELKPGLYTLMVAHPGYVPYRVEFSLADKTESFVVHLEPVKK